MNAPTCKTSLALVVVLSTAACVAGEEASTDKDELVVGCTSGKCDAFNLQPIESPLWASCFTDLAEDGTGSLQCVVPQDLPIRVDTLVFELTVDGQTVAGEVVRNPGSQPQKVIDLSGVELPATLSVLVSIEEGDTDVIGFDRTRLYYTVELDEKGLDGPLNLHAPFDLWPVQVATTLDLAIFNGDRISYNVSPYTLTRNGRQTKTHGRPSLFVSPAQEVFTGYLAVPAGGRGVSGKLEYQRAGSPTVEEGRGTIAGPGRWVVTKDGFRAPVGNESRLFPGIDRSGGSSECADEDFVPWLDDFGVQLSRVGDSIEADERDKLDEIIAKRPCNSTTDLAYLAWQRIFESRLKAFLPSRDSDLSASEVEVLTELLAQKPIASGDDAYADWFRHYSDRFAAAAPGSSSDIDGREQAILDIVLEARPATTSSAAFTRWMELYMAKMDVYMPNNTGNLESNELDNLEYIAAARPAAKEADAHMEWFKYYEARYREFAPNNRSSIDDSERVALDQIASIRPALNDDDAWLTWFALFQWKFDSFNGSIDIGAEIQLEALVSAKPCVVGDGSAASTYRSFQSEAQDRAAELADPTICR